MFSYKEMMKKRYKERKDNILKNLEKMTEEQLRWTVRLFRDCMKPKAIQKYLSEYNEFQQVEKLRDFVEKFVPVYTMLANRELKEKRGDEDDYILKNLTNEDLQSMSSFEKWEKMRKEGVLLKDYQLIREIARIGVSLKLDLLFDTSLAETAVEFPLYFELEERLEKLGRRELNTLANRILIAIRDVDKIREEESKSKKLGHLHSIIKEAIEITEPFENIIGEQMEKIPRGKSEPPEIVKLREALSKMESKDLKMSAMVNIDLLTMAEFKEIAEPFIKKYPSFFEMPDEEVREFIVAVSKKVGDRTVVDYIGRFSNGRLLFCEKMDEESWRGFSFGERLSFISQDNNLMDNSVIARHFARFLLTADYDSLFNINKQIGLILNREYMNIQTKFVSQFASKDGERTLQNLMNTISYKVLEMESMHADLRGEKLQEIKNLIGEKAGITSSILMPLRGRVQ